MLFSGVPEGCIAHSLNRLTLLPLILGSSALAVTPEGSSAVLEAVRTGEVFGAAAACGMPEARLVETGRRIIYVIRAKARTSEEVDRARVRHEQAVERGATDVKNGRQRCAAAIQAFEALDAEMPRI